MASRADNDFACFDIEPIMASCADDGPRGVSRVPIAACVPTVASFSESRALTQAVRADDGFAEPEIGASSG